MPPRSGAGNKFDGRTADSSMRRRTGAWNPDDNDDRQQCHKSAQKYTPAKHEIFKEYYIRAFYMISNTGLSVLDNLVIIITRSVLFYHFSVRNINMESWNYSYQ